MKNRGNKCIIKDVVIYQILYYPIVRKLYDFKVTKYLYFNLKVNNIYIYKPQYNTKQYIVDRLIEFFFYKNNLCFNIKFLD